MPMTWLPRIFRHAEPLGVRNFFQKNLGALFLILEILDSVTNVVLNDVVTQDDANGLAVGKMLRQT